MTWLRAILASTAFSVLAVSALSALPPDPARPADNHKFDEATGSRYLGAAGDFKVWAFRDPSTGCHYIGRNQWSMLPRIAPDGKTHLGCGHLLGGAR